MAIQKVVHAALAADALGAVFADWRAEVQRFAVLALVPEAEQHRLPTLQAACRAAAVDLKGAVFPALVSEAGFIAEGAWLLRMDGPATGFLLADLPQDAAAAAQDISAQVEQRLEQADDPQERPTLFMVFDGLLPNIASILGHVYLNLADRVAYSGVNAGSETFQPMPCLFDAQRAVGNGVLGLLLPDDAPFALAHGFKAPAHMMVATSGQGNRIDSIDWRPAYDVYAEIISRDYGVGLTRENFYSYAVHFPFGILRANGDVTVRIPVGLAEDGALYCIGEVPENAMLALLKAPGAHENACVDQIAAALHGKRNSGQELPVLVFYCAGRRMHLGASATEELLNLKQRAHASLLAGALSLGEIGASEGEVPVFHNAALVSSVWPAC